ncbi:MAG: NifU family protein [Candidatus Undinarchaeales archaeon]|jgi:Fe-S cluster biogenesis protein NfuA|nr:NifU family protein [Candidatus Undinarchaeales archaeon]
MEDEVKKIIETEIAPALKMDGGNIELLGVKDGVVKVKLQGACAGCPMSQMTLINFVEKTLKQKVPGVKRVEG